MVQLADEDGLHHDLQTISFRFVYGQTESPKSPAVTQQYWAMRIRKSSASSDYMNVWRDAA
jgi:hypothetical protein